MGKLVGKGVRDSDESSDCSDQLSDKEHTNVGLKYSKVTAK